MIRAEVEGNVQNGILRAIVHMMSRLLLLHNWMETQTNDLISNELAGAQWRPAQRHGASGFQAGVNRMV